MKILHLGTDEKFIDYAVDIFESVYPNSNDVIIFSKQKKLNFVKSKVSRIFLINLFNRFRPKISKDIYQEYDLVVFHSFADILYPEVFNIALGTPSIWLGWGYDYYGIIGNESELLLSETNQLCKSNVKQIIRSGLGRLLTRSLRLAGVAKAKTDAINKLTLFSPVLPNEYGLVKDSHLWKRFPKQAFWNYGTLEDHFIKGFENSSVDGNDILLGNSASATCNHKETLQLLNGFRLTSNRLIITPLSYGSNVYGKKISAIGNKLFGKNFLPLFKFMPVQDYVKIIKQCGYVIMNHRRQQAVGNIIIMLYLGAHVFLREENPTYHFLKNLGVKVSSVQQLEDNHDLLNTPLTAQQQLRNKQIVTEYWSREKGIFNTKGLVEQALAEMDK
ncbi:TDP-N-acetylfucosamine:lipid II N-acetylfucosaminyltransferase [Idiomarina loihiensis]|uniref:TDP-N-acetylfucosamine:lipid II N-acetylfucosaminyltransferase n=1 Tax=Idiomarina loihiensis TaxID=135577 RepID=UPI0039BE87C3